MAAMRKLPYQAWPFLPAPLNMMVERINDLSDLAATQSESVAVRVGNYVIFQDSDGGLKIQAPDGTLLPLMVQT